MFEEKTYKSLYVVSSYDYRTPHLEYNWINVLSKRVEKEPVSNKAFAYDGVDAFFFDSHKIWKVIHFLASTEEVISFNLKWLIFIFSDHYFLVNNSMFYLYLSLRTNALM